MPTLTSPSNGPSRPHTPTPPPVPEDRCARAKGRCAPYPPTPLRGRPRHRNRTAGAGDLTLGGAIANAEAVFLAPLLLQGYNLVIPDTEGQTADFAAGPEYAFTTLDSIRAATRSAETGMHSDTAIALMGYSGGAIATNWAAALAPGYAPEVNGKLVGFAEGGLLVDPAHNLKYVDGSLVWSGVIPMAVIGVSRSFGIDLKPYLSDDGLAVYRELEHGSIADALGHCGSACPPPCPGCARRECRFRSDLRPPLISITELVSWPVRPSRSARAARAMRSSRISSMRKALVRVRPVHRTSRQASAGRTVAPACRSRLGPAPSGPGSLLP